MSRLISRSDTGNAVLLSSNRGRTALPAWLPAIAALPALLLWPGLRHAIESRMLSHMLLEFPLLLAAGWSIRQLGTARSWLRRTDEVWQWMDWRGWTSASLLSATSALWMLPTLLDLSLLWPAVAAAKYVSWWMAGWAIGAGWHRLDPELRLLMLGNLAWMSGTAGLLYLEAQQRLCVNYLQDDQRDTGIGLIVLAALLGAWAMKEMMRPAK